MPTRLARAGAQLAGAIAVSELPRVREAVREPGGKVEIALDFGSEQGVSVIRGRVQGTLVLTCQRCLGAVEWPLDLAVATRVATSDAEEADLEAELECVRVDERGAMNLVTFVEDEILLALPPFASHAPSACPVDLEDWKVPAETGRDNPFAVLADLKRGRGN